MGWERLFDRGFILDGDGRMKDRLFISGIGIVSFLVLLTVGFISEQSFRSLRWILLPSQEDNEITRRIKESGEILAIHVPDHIIMGGERFYSFSDRGLL